MEHMDITCHSDRDKQKLKLMGAVSVHGHLRPDVQPERQHYADMGQEHNNCANQEA
jgi:hypothetical protein